MVALITYFLINIVEFFYFYIAFSSLYFPRYLGSRK